MASSDMPAPERIETADGHDPAYVRALEVEVHGLRERVAELETALDRKDETLAETERRLDRAESELERTQAELADREDELAAREAELAERERDLENATEWAEFLDEELRVQRDRVESLEARVESLEDVGSDARDGGDSLLARLRALFT